MKVYIRATQSISPQDTFMQIGIPETVIEYTNPLRNIRPDFNEYFSIIQSRRINDLIKTGHICAVETIKQAGIEKPDAIITGSGLGCVESTEKFLNNLLRTNEGLMAPTAFIQSTSNAVGAQIALHYSCNGYNVLYSQKLFSFENALLDAILRIKDEEEENILVGGIDEITSENCGLKQNIGLLKQPPFSNLNILKSTSTGSIPGEGTSFFLLSSDKNSDNLAEISAVYTNPKELKLPEIVEWINECLSKEAMSANDIDVVLAGLNGDKETDETYNQALNAVFNKSTQAYYKHMCGEYDTATSFGTWVAVNILKSGKLPEHAILSNRHRENRTILIYNQQNSKYQSLILLKQPD